MTGSIYAMREAMNPSKLDLFDGVYDDTLLLATESHFQIRVPSLEVGS